MMSTLPCPDSAAGLVPREMTAASDIHSLSQEWELQIECRAVFGCALHTNLARMLLNNSVGHRQSQPRTTPLAILRSDVGREEGIVNALDVLLSNAAARVRNHHAYAVAVVRGDLQRTA